MPTRVMFLTRSWPRLSQTFIVNEVLALERLGVDLDLWAMAPSGEPVRQPQVARVRAAVTHPTSVASPDDHALVAELAPQRYADTARLVRDRPELSSGYANATTAECFEVAVQLAARMARSEADGIRVAHLHAHFAHDPALVALLVHLLTGVGYSFTAHARDLYQIPRASLLARSRAATSLLTCCAANVDFLAAQLDPESMRKVRVIHHGIDLTQFVPGRPRTDGVTRIVSVGRLVEKKGFPDLLRACARLVGVAPFHLTVYGDGPMRGELEAVCRGLGVDDVVTFAGERDSPVIVDAMREADVFALTPFVTADGDRDGVPNVVVEALASGLPVVATDVGGVAEAVEHGQNGLLAPARDVAAVADHLGSLLRDPARRRMMGARARETAERSFDVNRAAEQLVQVFGVAEVTS
ncbi:glycosyltransferase family 4 protein [Terrabacter sp. 2RAF25]|uniref:glycosyltransferase family 4 protein n=1 Tax=Terrabacter sp. 2RAF25 TaxID=3232998 RepID=UPI003F9932F5